MLSPLHQGLLDRGRSLPQSWFARTQRHLGCDVLLWFTAVQARFSASQTRAPSKPFACACKHKVSSCCMQRPVAARAVVWSGFPMRALRSFVTRYPLRTLVSGGSLGRRREAGGTREGKDSPLALGFWMVLAPSALSVLLTPRFSLPSLPELSACAPRERQRAATHLHPHQEEPHLFPARVTFTV